MGCDVGTTFISGRFERFVQTHLESAPFVCARLYSACKLPSNLPCIRKGEMLSSTQTSSIDLFVMTCIEDGFDHIDSLAVPPGNYDVSVTKHACKINSNSQ